MCLLQRCHCFTCQKSSRLAGTGTTAYSPSTGRSCRVPVCWVRIGSRQGSSRQPRSVQSSLPAWPGRSSCKQQHMDRNLDKGVCFSASPRYCVWQALLAGPPGTAREWGWDKLFLRSHLLCSSLFSASSPRARSLLSEIPQMFLTLLPIQRLSS